MLPEKRLLGHSELVLLIGVCNLLTQEKEQLRSLDYPISDRVYTLESRLVFPSLY